MPLHQLVSYAADRHPNRVALLQGDLFLTYFDVARQVRALAQGLAGMELASGARLAIYLGKGVEAVIACFAASAADMAFVPINPLLKARQVHYILDHSTAAVLLTSADRLQLLLDADALPDSVEHIILVDHAVRLVGGVQSRSLYTWNGLVTLSADAWPAGLDPQDDTSKLAALFYTSGSTGNAKGVMFSHHNMILGAQSVASYLGNTPDDRLISVLPLSFDYGWSQITTAFHVGASVALVTYLLPRDVLRALEKVDGTGLAAVPPLWQELAQLDWPGHVAARLRYITNSGGHMPRQTLMALREKLPNTSVFLMYGLTEAFRSTYLPPDQVEIRPDSIGKAIPHAQVRVLRQDGTPCDPGETGEIVHSGPLVGMGYWHDAEATAVRFRPVRGEQAPSVWSGDLARTDDEGYLYFVARGDDMIKTSGYRVSPSEVEEGLCAVLGVTEAAVFGVSDSALGQAIAAFVAGPSVPSEETLLAALRQELPGFMLPRYIKAMDQLPRSANGKIDRTYLRGQLPEKLP